jgi:hypothetical protein
MSDNYTVQDLIKFSYEQKPLDFENAFKSVLGDKLTNAIELKKQEMAQDVFPEEQEDIPYDPENDLESDEDFEDLDLENDSEIDTEGHQDDQNS